MKPKASIQVKLFANLRRSAIPRGYTVSNAKPRYTRKNKHKNQNND